MTQSGRGLGRTALVGLGLAAALLVGSCTNNPYPASDAGKKIYYSSFSEAPRTLDPAVAYDVSSQQVTGNIYSTLLEYHYLKRPYMLIPALATSVPKPEPRPGGRVAYHFHLREGALYQNDPCFSLDGRGRHTRQVVAADVAFELMRVGDPAVGSPVTDPFSNVVGFREFGERLKAKREADPSFGRLPIREQYQHVGGIEGVRVLGPADLEILLRAPYPQILYWFAMQFTSPVPWEAVTWYDGREHARFADHPVGSGPYYLAEYRKQYRIVLEANPNWYGVRHPEWKAGGAVYPSHGAPGDRAKGLLDPSVVGKPLPFIQRLEFNREKESVPRFNKFLQGYYDTGGIIKESFDKVIQNDRLSPQMAARGIVLDKSVSPGVYYLGFNMNDKVVGMPAGERGRKLRQAMSLVVDSKQWVRLFLNGRGIPAQSPLPPGIFGYDPHYRNPYRQPNLARARKLLAEAGYPNGIDPRTGRPLRLSFDIYQASSEQRTEDEFFVKEWRSIGIDVEIDGTTYNEFQEKVKRGAYQIFFWGWQADYPDPENFLFLLTCAMRASTVQGPNTANFCNPRYDALFEEMRVRQNDAKRREIIRKMVDLLARERPWIELFHPENYALYHDWLLHVKSFGMSYPMVKYMDLDVKKRAAQRRAWNRPVRWPAYALAGLAILVILPGIRTFLRERQ